ncbi:hypothetical protein CISG_09943 [Coccidioides immitis RMSCC 3703]|uniref:Uncharacterized protein n=1 Tax=Coccidioides immitis RMSCC 3703 TaxID=454286 RepID=A0A0J8QKK8_COCIT|nr:hypothetical protein CISG_09943 [Coccidioides immitis RMSCC 3703]
MAPPSFCRLEGHEKKAQRILRHGALSADKRLTRGGWVATKIEINKWDRRLEKTQFAWSSPCQTVAHSDRPVLNSPRYIINLTTEHQRRALRARAAVPVEHFLLALEVLVRSIPYIWGDFRTGLFIQQSSPPSTQVLPTPGVPGRSRWCPAPF